MANPAVGEVDIELNGKVETLKSTLPAARLVSQLGGGFLNASARVSVMDFDLCVAIVAAGLGKQSKDVENAVFATGLADLIGPISTFVTYLANGGKPPKEDAPASGEA
jgi:hypothetical protein